jgi:hypothetical protein
MHRRELGRLAACALLIAAVLTLVITLWSYWSTPVLLASLGWHG